MSSVNSVVNEALEHLCDGCMAIISCLRNLPYQPYAPPQGKSPPLRPFHRGLSLISRTGMKEGSVWSSSARAHARLMQGSRNASRYCDPPRVDDHHDAPLNRTSKYSSPLGAPGTLWCPFVEPVRRDNPTEHSRLPSYKSGIFQQGLHHHRLLRGGGGYPEQQETLAKRARRGAPHIWHDITREKKGLSRHAVLGLSCCFHPYGWVDARKVLCCMRSPQIVRSLLPSRGLRRVGRRMILCARRSGRRKRLCPSIRSFSLSRRMNREKQ